MKSVPVTYETLWSTRVAGRSVIPLRTTYNPDPSASPPELSPPSASTRDGSTLLRGGAQSSALMIDRTESLLGEPTCSVAVASPSPPLPPRPRVPPCGCIETRHCAHDTLPDALVGACHGALCRIFAITRQLDAHVGSAPGADASLVLFGHTDSEPGATLCQGPCSLITDSQGRISAVACNDSGAPALCGTL
jgi:hypothetical protein